MNPKVIGAITLILSNVAANSEVHMIETNNQHNGLAMQSNFNDLKKTKK